MTDCSFHNDIILSQAEDYAVVISNSSGVAFSKCSMVGRGHGWNFVDPGQGFNGVSALSIHQSSVALYSCEVRGGHGESRTNGIVGQFGNGGDGGDGVRLVGSGDFFAADCTILGGSFGVGQDNFGQDGHCGVALNAQSANYSIRLLAGNITGPTANPCAVGVFGTGGTLDVLPGEATLLFGPNSVQDIEDLSLTISGEPGARVGLLFSSGHDNNFSSPFGPTLVQIQNGPNQQWSRYLGRIGGSGTMQVDIPMRPIPAFTHVRLHLMAVSLSPLGPRTSNPATPVLLDAAW